MLKLVYPRELHKQDVTALCVSRQLQSQVNKRRQSLLKLAAERCCCKYSLRDYEQEKVCVCVCGCQLNLSKAHTHCA